MGVSIHSSAVIDPTAELGENVTVGPFSVIGPRCVVGDNTVLQSNVLIDKNTTVGKGCEFFHGASIGTDPQDLKFHGEETVLEIGDNSRFREFCTINRGTEASGKTVIGNGCTLLAYSHVGHDCILGNNIVASNNLTLAGHVEIDDNVIFGGLAAVHQFAKIGRGCFIGAGSLVSKDVLPFALVANNSGRDVRIVGINKVGLERAGYDENERRKIKAIYKVLFREKRTVEEAKEILSEKFAEDKEWYVIKNFLDNSTRGLVGMVL